MAFLPFDMDYLTDEMIMKAEKELGETKETREKALSELRENIKEDKTLRVLMDDSYFMLILRCRKFDVKKAGVLFRTVLDLKEKYPEVVDRRDFECIRKVCCDKFISVLPHRDRDGALIVLYQFPCVRFEELPVEAYFHATMTMLLWCAYRCPATQICGFKLILDLSELSIDHMRHVSPRFLLTLIQIVNKCVPARLGAMHIVNEPLIMHYTWKLVKLTLSEKIKKRVYFHSTNLSGLHKKIDPVLLPKEVGGTLIYDNSPWLKMMEQFEDQYYHMYENSGFAHKEK